LETEKDLDTVMGPEMGPVDAITNTIGFGCLMAFFVFAVFGFGAAILLLIKAIKLCILN
jgi:hypothetical protein